MKPGVVRRAPGLGRRRSAGPLALAATVVLAGACARAMGPPGGERDELPPAVIQVWPDTMSTIEATGRPVVFVFDERISEQNYRDAVYVSPATGAADISKGRREIEVRIAGGWQPGRVYRVVLRPVLQDLFNNTMQRQVEIAFSTGAPFSEAAVAGLAYERVTGTPLADVRVEARPLDGGAYHLALSDTGGVFRLPLIPPGTYLLRGYVDQNRDRRRDSFEPADSVTIDVFATDTVLRPLALMRPDTTPANLTRVELADSMTLRLQFDDYMDVSQPQARVFVRLRSVPDSADVATAGIYYPHALTALRARQDSIARDSLASLEAPDTAGAPVRDRPLPSSLDLRAPADTLGNDSLPPDPLTMRVREAALAPVRGAPLPARDLMVLLASPLVPGAAYHVEVSGVLNLSGIAGGGGASPFEAPVPPAPAAPAVAPGGDPAAPETAPAELGTDPARPAEGEAQPDPEAGPQR